jgi:hypothetical protein
LSNFIHFQRPNSPGSFGSIAWEVTLDARYAFHSIAYAYTKIKRLTCYGYEALQALFKFLIWCITYFSCIVCGLEQSHVSGRKQGHTWVRLSCTPTEQFRAQKASTLDVFSIRLAWRIRIHRTHRGLPFPHYRAMYRQPIRNDAC